MPRRLFLSLREYRRGWLRGDVVAGLTVWAVLVPESLAYASIAGVSPVVGLYAAPAALLLYAVFGSSRQLIVGPMSATAALSAAAIAPYAAGGSSDFVALTAALAVCTGIIAVLAGLLRLGFLASFISEPVIKGFIVGLALTIIAGQLPKVFGVSGGSGNFFEKVWHVLAHLGDTSGWTLVVAAASLAVVLGLRRWAPALPGSFVAVVLGVVAVKAFGLDDRGVDIVGPIAGGLPTVGLPEVSFREYLELGASGLGVALVGFAEGLGAAKTYAARDGDDIDPERELIGLGAANIGAGLSSGMVVNGSLSKTAVNGDAGARSQLSGLLVAVLAVVTLLLLTSLFEDLPEPTLAAVVIAAVIELVDVSSLAGFYRLWTSRLGSIYGRAARADFVAALAAMLGVLAFDTLPGLFIGIGMSLLLLLYRASRPNVAELGRLPDEAHWLDLARAPDARPAPGVVVLRVEAGLFFANADWVRAALLRAGAREGTTTVVLDAESVPYIDLTAARMLLETRSALDRRGVRMSLARDVGQVRDVLERAAATSERAAPRRVFPTVREAVEDAQAVAPEQA